MNKKAKNETEMMEIEAWNYIKAASSGGQSPLL